MPTRLTSFGCPKSQIIISQTQKPPTFNLPLPTELLHLKVHKQRHYAHCICIRILNFKQFKRRHFRQTKEGRTTSLLHFFFRLTRRVFLISDSRGIKNIVYIVSTMGLLIQHHIHKQTRQNDNVGVARPTDDLE